ncbi:unnamed protein product, partial [Nezara viridula]
IPFTVNNDKSITRDKVVLLSGDPTVKQFGRIRLILELIHEKEEDSSTRCKRLDGSKEVVGELGARRLPIGRKELERGEILPHESWGLVQPLEVFQ